MHRFLSSRSISLAAKLYSRRNFGTFYAYECSKFINKDLDGKLLEKSIRFGCRSIIERSGSSEASRTYELISDLTATGDLDLNELFLVHQLSPPSEGKQWDTELQDIKSILRRRLPDVVTLPIVSLDVASSLLDLTREVERSLATILDQSSSAGTVSVSIGFDISTEVLSKATDADLSTLIRALDNSIAQGGGRLKYLSVASNCFTHRAAAQLSSWAEKNGVSIISTEVLRAHERRPGLLSNTSIQATHSTPNPNLNPASSGSGSDKKDEKDGKEEALVTSTMEGLKKSLNACIHVEKQFIEKVNKLGESGGVRVPPQSMCWGHILAQTSSNIAFPEEWDYFLNKQVRPALNESLNKLRAADKTCNDWVLLYDPMVRQLFWSFAASLDARRAVLNTEVEGLLDKYDVGSIAAAAGTTGNNSTYSGGSSGGAGSGAGSSQKTSTAMGLLPLQARLALISSNSLGGSNLVALAGTEVRENEWLGGALIQKPMGSSTSNSSKINSDNNIDGDYSALYTDIQSVLANYSESK